MSQKHVLFSMSVTAGASFNADLAVHYDGNLATPGGIMLGIADTDAEAGAMLNVDVLGTSIATAGAAFAANADLEIGNNGQLIAQSAGITVARSLEAASAAGDKVEVMLLPK